MFNADKEISKTVDNSEDATRTINVHAFLNYALNIAYVIRKMMKTGNVALLYFARRMPTVLAKRIIVLTLTEMTKDQI